MTLDSTQAKRALRLAERTGLLLAREAREAGIDTAVLTRLVRRGDLVRVARGVYELPDADVSENHTLAEVAAQAPGVVVCLLSALAFHGMTTELPFDVWLAHRRGTRPPALSGHEVRLFRYGVAAFDHGVEEHQVDGVAVRVTTPAKTVADCFKFRSATGLDVAMEALKDYVRGRRGSVDELWSAAEVCRVQLVIRPYLEMVV